MKITKQARTQAKRLLRMCMRDGLLDADRVSRAVARILEVHPRGYLAILVHLRRLVQLEEERRSVLVESAVRLEPELQTGIRASLERRYGPGLSFRFAQKESLLGGIRVQVGSDVYDGTVWARLDGVRRAFDAE